MASTPVKEKHFTHFAYCNRPVYCCQANNLDSHTILHPIPESSAAVDRGGILQLSFRVEFGLPILPAVFFCQFMI